MNAERVLRAAMRLLPESRRELGAALLAEASRIPDERRAAWLFGGLWFVFREGVLPRLRYPSSLVVAVGVLATFDRFGTSDDAEKITLLVLLGFAGVLGFLAPRWAWLAGVLLGSTVAVVELLFSRQTGAHGSPVTLFVLVVPALLAAYAGAMTVWFRRRARGRA
jgi:hypothetical protein